MDAKLAFVVLVLVNPAVLVHLGPTLWWLAPQVCELARWWVEALAALSLLLVMYLMMIGVLVDTLCRNVRTMWPSRRTSG